MRWNRTAFAAVVLVAVAAGWLLTRTVREPAVDDDADVDRELAELSAALRDDAVLRLDLAPEASAGIHFPSAIQYLRGSDFWRPVLGSVRRMGRGGRRGRR